MSLSEACLRALREAVGASHVLTEGDLSAYQIDWRKRWRGKAGAVVRPADTAEVAAVVRICREHGGEWDEPAGGGSVGAWREAFIRMPYLRDLLLRLGVASATRRMTLRRSVFSAGLFRASVFEIASSWVGELRAGRAVLTSNP